MSEKEVMKQDKKAPSQARQDRLKEIESLYRNQIKQIYSDSKEKEAALKHDNQTKKPVSSIINKQPQPPTIPHSNMQSPSRINKGMTHVKSATHIPGESAIGSRYFNFQEGEEKVRASVLLKGESTRTIQVLRKENESKELKIRQLTNRCEALVEKLRRHVEPAELERELESVKEYSEDKMERLENLFKIKNQEIFFKIKLQIIALLQEFGMSKEQLADINEVSNESTLFSFMTRKLKGRLKDFKSKEQEKTFEIQKDRILNQKHEERIHYLTETNELLRLAEGKLKGKVEDLKGQLNEYLERLRLREHQNEERESEIFRLRKQNEELGSVNQKLSSSVRGANGEKVEERRVWEAKEKELKGLLNNYLLERKRLEGALEEKEGEAEEVLIRQRFLEQENERLNRELVRWKERYEGLVREKEAKVREFEEERAQLGADFETYKLEHNQGLELAQRSEVEEALRKVEEYQRAYQAVLGELEEERRLLQRSEEQAEERLERLEGVWLEKVKKAERQRAEEVREKEEEGEAAVGQLREEFQQKERLLVEEMQAKMKALLAERDKKMTQQLMFQESENEDLRKQIDSLHKLLDVKQSLISVIQGGKPNWSAHDK